MSTMLDAKIYSWKRPMSQPEWQTPTTVLVYTSVRQRRVVVYRQFITTWMQSFLCAYSKGSQPVGLFS